MATENQIRFIEALESGKYKQGRGCLKNPDGEYCCLGVGHEVFFPDIEIPLGEKHRSGKWVEQYDPTTNSSPADSCYKRLREVLGFDPGSAFQVNGFALTSMNDIRKMSFEEIAAKCREAWNYPKAG